MTTVLKLWSQSSRLSHCLPQRETAKYAIVCTPFSRHGPCVYTAQGKLPAWARTPIYPPGPYTHWRFIGFHSDVNATAPRFQGGLGSRCCAVSKETTQHIIMSSSNWKERNLRAADHVREGDAVALNKERWCDLRERPEELSLQGFCRDKKRCGKQNK